ncbi:type II secretion system protein N [uncultured Ferrimonas sp.]|uniref:type II secretion system protein N n=1 Tax=uncultured Ferrimonas sp. TaxID=432640 RepID=UPI0026076103|nr:type II secretion system protein N [uncultured Ferrimonas sp.]
MKQAVKYSLIGAVIFSFFLLINTPAAWIWQLLPNKPKQVQLSEISGSLWQGKIGYAKVAGRELEQLSWDLIPSALLGGNVALDLSIDGAVVQGKGHVQYGLAGLQAQGLRLQAPLPWLVGKQRLPLRTRLAGGVTLNLRTLAQGLPWCEQLQGRLLLEQLDVNNQFGAYPLGNIAANLGCQQGQVVVQVDQAENRIGVNGELRLLANNQVQVNATIRETEGQPDSLRQALSFIGKPDASGAYPLNYSGAIPGL